MAIVEKLKLFIVIEMSELESRFVEERGVGVSLFKVLDKVNRIHSLVQYSGFRVKRILFRI